MDSWCNFGVQLEVRVIPNLTTETPVVEKSINLTAEASGSAVIFRFFLTTAEGSQRTQRKRRLSE
jgi:hypothetical protein